MGNKLSNPSVVAQPRTGSQPTMRTVSTPTVAQRISRSSLFSFLGPENLDTRETLRRLVTNSAIRGFDYASKEFKFWTLFHQSSYSYCCCSCAYDHEYVSYISEEGEINEEIYERIVESIIKGYCPHVTTGRQKLEYNRDTRILAMHIAAAAGTTPKNKDFYRTGEDRASAIFKLCPKQVAMFHNNLEFVREDIENYKIRTVNNDLEIVASGLHHASRMPGDEYKVLFKYMTQTEFCISQYKRQMLQLVLDPFWTQHCLKALQKCFADPGLSDMQNDILDYLRIVRSQFKVRDLSRCAISAIASNNDLALRCLLDMLKSMKYADDLTIELPNICKVLGKTRQEIILSEYGYKGRKMGDGDHFHLTMLHYLRQNCTENYYDQIKDAFDKLSAKQQATINTVYNNCAELTPLHIAVFDLKPREVETLLRMGADINIKSKHGETPLIQHLRKIDRWYVLNIKKFREVLTILIYENPDIELNNSAVEDGIALDEFFMKRVSSQTFEISGAYLLDGQEHSVFSAEDGFALNFIAPLLIECGFIYSNNILLAALQKRLNPTEREYFQHYLDNPRSLQMSCRDRLRKHFKNRGIHKYVSRLGSNIPEKIKDFILMRNVLTSTKIFCNR